MHCCCTGVIRLDDPKPSDVILSARELRKQFGSLVVLDDVSLMLAAGEALGVVGPNGAGKTTLQSVLSARKAVSSGEVRYRGIDVTSLPASERCRVGLVRTHQIPQPFLGMTVFENVLWRLPTAADTRPRKPTISHWKRLRRPA